jgi:hypothetical protein
VKLSNLQELFDEAKRLTGHTEFVVAGSLSILGLVDQQDVPGRMIMSIDVDCFTRHDPARIFELNDALGERSAFAAKHGFYLDPISPDLPTLPENWGHRLIHVPLGNGIAVYFLDPNDAAVSKYARCEPRDREWIQAGLKAGLLSATVIASRFRETDFFDAPERERATTALDTDRAAVARNAKRGASRRER